MKKIISKTLISVFLFTVTAAIMFAAAFNRDFSAFADAALGSSSALSGISVSAEKIEEYHSAFQAVGGGDRRSFLSGSFDYEKSEGQKKGEQLAADFISERLSSFYAPSDPATTDPLTTDPSSAPTTNDPIASNFSTSAISRQGDVTVQVITDSFSEQFTTSAGSLFYQSEEETRWSQNIILRFDTPSSERVVIGANLDNSYKSGNDGAMLSGAPVATLLALSEELSGDYGELFFDLDIVFFGAGYYDGTPYFVGAERYFDNNLTRIPLMINIGRQGGGRTYVYSDEVRTQLLDYCLSLGDFYALPASLPLVSSDSQGGPKKIPYAHYGMQGNHSRFTDNGITSVNFFCGDYGGISLSDTLLGGRGDNILANDTIQNMLAANPKAYQKMEQTAAALAVMINNTGLLTAVNASNNDKFDYSVFLYSWIAYLILAGIILVSFVLLLHFSRRLAAKYPRVRIRQAAPVFGEEYENRTYKGGGRGQNGGQNSGKADPFYDGGDSGGDGHDGN